LNIIERYLYHLSYWWLPVILVTCVVGAASYWFASSSPGAFQANATLLVNLTETPGTIVLDDVLLSERLTATYEELITTRPILDDVASQLPNVGTGQDLEDKISVSAVPGTQLIRIEVRDDDPESAALIANTVASVFSEENNRTPAGETITIIESAIPPDAREGPSLMVRTLLGLLAGASLGFLIVLGRTYLDGTVWDPDDLKGPASRLPILGILREGDLVSAETPSDSPFLPPLSEPYRVLTANVLAGLTRARGSDSGPKKVAIVSAFTGEGKTTLTARLGVSAALEGYRVTLVDFDSVNPSLHAEFGLDWPSRPDNGPNGGPDWVPTDDAKAELYRRGNIEVEPADVIRQDALFAPPRETLLNGLSVVAYRRSPDGPSMEYVSVQETRAALTQATSNGSDLILFDTVAYRTGIGTNTATQVADFAIIVVEAKRTPIDSLASLVGSLEATGTQALGIVINKR
jgi:capsular polysaccharide biosynthesis protein/cellulose biosynthesis protein BcsQ